jgi:hypothetical protein
MVLSAHQSRRKSRRTEFTEFIEFFEGTYPMRIVAPAPGGRPPAARARRYLTALAMTVVSIVASAVLAAPAAHAATSTVGGPITNTEVLARAAYWLSLSPPYLSSGSAPDPQGRNYRTDCSGLVDMAWHLASGPNTDALATSTYTTPIAGSALQPGDLLDYVVSGAPDHHAILFDAWASDHVHFSYYTFGAYPMKLKTGATLATGDNYKTNGVYQLSGLPASGYTYYRYKNIIDDGQLEQEPNGEMAVTVGGAAAIFQSTAELTDAGYAGVTPTEVPAGTFEGMAKVPNTGTLIRDNVTGEIDIIAGGARYHLSGTEWVGLHTPAYVNVPESFFGTLGSSPGIPSDGTYLGDNTTGAIYLVAGGVAYHLSFTDWTQLSSPAFTDVPIDWINTLPTAPATLPASGTIIRDVGTGAIYQMYDTCELYLTAAAWAGLHSPGYTNLPSSWINSIPSCPY